jgi:predicted small integral membrane protein
LESLKEREQSENLGVNRRIIVNLRETALVGVDWIHLAQDRNRWWALVNTIMNLRVL